MYTVASLSGQTVKIYGDYDNRKDAFKAFSDLVKDVYNEYLNKYMIRTVSTTSTPFNVKVSIDEEKFMEEVWEEEEGEENENVVSYNTGLSGIMIYIIKR